MIIRDFKPEDLKTIKAIEPFMENPEGWEKVINNSIAFTAEEDGRPIACGGVVVGEEAMMWARTNGKATIKVYRALKEGLRILIDELGDMEYIAFILDGFDIGRRFAERFGFKKTNTTIEHDNHVYHRYRLWPERCY